MHILFWGFGGHEKFVLILRYFSVLLQIKLSGYLKVSIDIINPFRVGDCFIRISDCSIILFYSILLMLYSANTEGLQQYVLQPYVHGELTLELKPKDK